MRQTTSIYTLLIVILATAIPLGLASNAQGTTVYKKLDNNGNLVFSDEPFDGAQAITVQPVSTIKLHTPKNAPILTSIPGNALVTEHNQDNYSSLIITSPAQDSTLLNTGGLGTVTAASTPSLKKEHLYQLLINGESKGTQSSASFSLNGLFRGAHTAVMQIINRSSGEVIKVSPPVTFYIRQHSIQH